VQSLNKRWKNPKCPQLPIREWGKRGLIDFTVTSGGQRRPKVESVLLSGIHHDEILMLDHGVLPDTTMLRAIGAEIIRGSEAHTSNAMW
jgi:hypothetical protein